MFGMRRKVVALFAGELKQLREVRGRVARQQ